MNTKDDYASDLPAILIIDDDAPTLELYAGVLSQNYPVLTCSNWETALDLLATRKLRLVVLEPSVAGYQSRSLLEKIIQATRVPVVVCSALDDRKFGLNAGATAYLVKPVLPLVLLDVLKSVLDQPSSPVNPA